MKNKFIIFYTIFASIGFLFALSFLSLNLYREYKYNSLTCEKKFNNIVGELTYGSKDPNLNTKSLLDKLNKSIGSLNDFSYLNISINDVEIIKYPSKANQNDTASKLTKSYDKVIQTEVGNFHIVCNIFLLKPASVYYYGKVAFIIVLLITLLTIVIIIYENISDGKENSNPTVEIENSENDEIDSVSTEAVKEALPNQEVIVNSEDSSNTDEIEKNNDNEAEPVDTAIETEETRANETESSSDTNTQAEVDSNKDEQMEEKAQLPSEEEKPLQLNNENPRGLFNPVTGLGWEEYLLTRLDSELNRAIASEIDLSLFIIQLPGLSRDSEYVKNVCNYLTIQFQFKDLLFEYQEDCLVAMKINMNLDEALNLADKVYSGIKNIIEENPCYIGISTRSIRMVSGQRVLKEATEALAHTKDDKDSPIIAFRVDTDKYKQFLEQNNSK